MRTTSASQHLLAKIAPNVALLVVTILTLLMAAFAMSPAANLKITATQTARNRCSRLTTYQMGRST
jgi:hypothetical protein